MHDALRLREPPGGRQHQRDGEVGGRVGEHVRGVADRDPSGRRRVDVDVVGADREVGDRPQAGGGRDQLGVDDAR